VLFRSLQSPSPLLDLQYCVTNGRYLIAAKDIRRGQVLLSERAFASVADNDSNSKTCSCCLSQAKQADIRCHDCKYTVYCSLDCQNNDSFIHRFECMTFSRHRESGEFDGYTLDFLRLLMRILILGCSTEPQSQTTSNNTVDEIHASFSDIDNLCSNASLFQPSRKNEISNVAKALESFVMSAGLDITVLKEVSSADDTELVRKLVPNASDIFIKIFMLICKEECNSFGLYDFATGHTQPRHPFGLAIFPRIVFFNHSCRPNIGYVQRKTVMTLYDYLPSTHNI